MNKKSCLLLPLFLCLLVSGLWAQKNKDKVDVSTRSVEGIVTEAGGKPVSGAVVQLKDTKTLQIRSFITQADGTYHFAGLSSSVDYEIKAALNGAVSNNKTLSTFDSRKVATVNLKFK